MSVRLDAFVVAVPGLEPLLLDEVQKLGVRPARIVRGGVECNITWPQLWSINLRSRVATRVLVRVAKFHADGFHSLQVGIKGIDWSAWLAPDTGVTVSATTDKVSKLYHSVAVEERVAEAMGRPLGSQAVQVRVLGDVVTVSLDSSGAPLHHRGWRGVAGRAPMRESLAAALVLASGWNMKTPLVDPFCGSGTVAIEAAMLARRMAPGRNRSFAFEQWSSFDSAGWERLLRGADGDVVQKCPPIIASDRDEGAIASVVDNAARAGVGGNVEAVRRAVSDLVLPPRAGWLVTNPPYGHRVGDTSGGQDLRNLYDRLGTVLRERASGWHVALLAAHDTPISRMKLPLQPTLTTLNGGISVAVHTGTLGGPGGVGSAATQRSATPASVATESATPESVVDAAASAEPESE
jgi:putative N6-adenine-specific DNA methylase